MSSELKTGGGVGMRSQVSDNKATVKAKENQDHTAQHSSPSLKAGFPLNSYTSSSSLLIYFILFYFS